MRAARVIQSEGQEDDTYWIYLVPGFHNGSGEHAIAEDNKRTARGRLTDVEPCDCADCQREIAKNPHAVALGRKGGSVVSDAKAAAVRENGKKGGRPPKPHERLS